MATGHINPGYRHMITDCRRTKSAFAPGSIPGGQMIRDFKDRGVDQATLEDIRRRAREVWSSRPPVQTSYQAHYGNKIVQLDEPTKARPNSPRSNRPHPSLAFLTCRLHTVPGFYNPDATLGKPTNQVDAVTGSNENQARSYLRHTYTSRPATATVQPLTRKQYPYGVETDAPPFEPEYAWLATDADPYDEMCDDYMPITPTQTPEFDRPKTPHFPSAQRYLRAAGAEERELIQGITYGHRTPFPMQRPKTTGSIHHSRMRDVSKMRQFKCKPSSIRGEYTIHPEWPPQMGHHRLNGLTNVTGEKREIPRWR